MNLYQAYKRPSGPEYEIVSGYSQSGLSLFNEKSGIEGIDFIPMEGETVKMYSDYLGSVDSVDFKPELNNKMYYLFSNDIIQNRDSIVSQGTSISMTLVLGRYEGQFTYSNPNDYKYFYIVSDYTNNISTGLTITYTFGLNQKEVIDAYLNDNVGVVKFDYSHSSGPFRIAIEYMGNLVADTGELPTASIGSLSFIKDNSTINECRLIVESMVSSNIVEIKSLGTTLTPFYLDVTSGTTGDVCSQVADRLLYHDGSNSLPVAGDTIYVDAVGSSVFDGENAYHVISTSLMVVPSGSSVYAAINNLGVVISTGSCVCSEASIPVITQTDITVAQNQQFSISVEVTNNPTSWTVISSCDKYALYGGAKGSVFTYTDCDSISRRATVSSDSSYEVCASVAPTVVTGTGAFALVDVCQDKSLPAGIQFKDGILFGSPVTTGSKTIELIASNCVGNSLNVSFDLIVESSVNLTPFAIDVSVASDSDSDSCALTGSFSLLYHNGVNAVPDLNDTIFIDQKARERFVGGKLWYLADDTTPYALQIDQLGVVIDKQSC